MQAKLNAVIIGIVLFGVMVAVGYAALKSSSYMDVSMLKSYTTEVKATIKGEPLVIGTGNLYLKIGNSFFLVEAHGVYGVAKRIEGPPIGNDDSYAVFVLAGKNGDSIVAIYAAREFRAKYGMRVDVSDRVVVEGLYKPQLYASLISPDGTLILNAPVFIVDKILEGCHKSYKQPVGAISS